MRFGLSILRLISLPFPTWCPHLEFATNYWNSVLREGDSAVDATCGNGKDTQRIAKLLSGNGRLIALDIQKQAIEHTRAHLLQSLPQEQSHRVMLIQQSHVSFPIQTNHCNIKIVVYNLGYLPGGNKEFTTKVENTLISLERASSLILPGGLISVMCYPGHPEGAKETQALYSFAEALSKKMWLALHHFYPQQPKRPMLFIFRRKARASL